MSEAAVDSILQLDQFGAKLGLDEIRVLLAALGSPQHGLPVVLVAGTNGKGSTSALLAGIARAAGYRVGLYTSPHLERPEERLRLDGRAIASAELAALLGEVLDTHRRASGGAPTYFEALTAAALLWYRRLAVDLAVLEVGLGGRLDATNASAPLLAVITGIDFDHQEHLGDTLPSIAREKAGIMRPGVPALSWGDGQYAGEGGYAATLEARARELGAPLHDAERETHRRVLEPALAPGWQVALRTPERGLVLRCPLLGEHQALNLATAVRAAELLAGRGFTRLDQRAMVAGVGAWRWPGRLEELVLPGGQRVLLDGAHNPAGARVLGRFLAQRGEPFDLLFGCLRAKDARWMLGALAPLARRVVVTRSRAGKTRDPLELQAIARQCGAHRVAAAAELEPAWSSLAADPAPLVVVAGSLYLQGELRPLLRSRYRVPAPVRDAVV